MKFRTRTVVAFALTLPLGAVVSSAMAVPAAAHDQTGTISLTAAEPDGDRTVRYDVAVTFLNDGHGAPDATVTVVGELAGQPRVGPVAMDPAGEEGRYRASLTFPAPGLWTVRFSSLSPQATLEQAQEIAGPSGPSSVAQPTTTAPTVAPTNQTTTPSSPVPSSVVSATTVPDDSPGSAGTFVFLGVTAAVAAVGSVLALRSRGTRRR